MTGTVRDVFLAAGFCLGLAACGPMGLDQQEGSVMPDDGGQQARSESAQVTTPPVGAIEVGNGVYMVPVPTEDGKCPRYTPWSATRAVVAAIHYRRADGSFTLNRDEADCGS